MQNKGLANVSTCVESCDVVTRGKINSLLTEVDGKHELCENLIVKSTSEKHEEQLKQRNYISLNK